MMVDELLRVEGDDAVCQLTIRPDNYFITPEGQLAEVGIIEHMAQSASAFAGYKAMADGADKPPVGYIGEIKNFRLVRQPQLGEVVQTTISMGPAVGGITIITAQSCVGEEVVAKTTMKIFIKE